MRAYKLLGFILISVVCNHSYAVSKVSFERLGVNIPPKTQPYKGIISTAAGQITSKDGTLVFENGHFRFQVVTSPVLQLTQLYSKYADANCLMENSRLFIAWLDGKRLSEKDFAVKDVEVVENGGRKSAVILFQLLSEQCTGRLVISIDDSTEIQFDLSLTNGSDKARSYRMLFPYFENVQMGQNGAENYYFFPLKGGICSNKPYELQSGYGSHNGSIQLISLYNPQLGSGIYTRVEDAGGRTKTFVFQKKDCDGDEAIGSFRNFQGIFAEMTFNEKDIFPNARGSVLSCYSYPSNVEPNAELKMPRSVLAVHGGDFTYALDRYSKWLRTWWKHEIGTPQWYKDCYFYPVAHDIAGNTGWEKGFIRDNKIVLSQIARPYEHMIQLAFWGEHPKDDGLGDKRDVSWYRFAMPGNFNYEESWGGLSALREEIKKTRMIGPRISLYGATQYGTWLFSDVYKQHPDWAQIDQLGREVHDYWWDLDNNKNRVRIVNMCGQVEEWQDYVAQTNHRIIKDTGASGIYLDVMNQIPFCYNPKHKHEEYPAISAEKLLKKNLAAVRSADPEAVIEIEDFCSDYLLQWVDGCWMKTFYQDLPPEFEDTFDLYSVSFVRFMIPEVKWPDFGPRWIHGSRRAFFNGMGYNLSEVNNKNDDEAAQRITKEQRVDYLIVTDQLMKESSDVFSSVDCRCLVPTLQENVYANYFGANGKKFYTLYNKNDSPIQGQLIKTEGGGSYHGVELLYDNEIEYDGQSGITAMTVKPWDVVCVAKLPRIMSLEQQGSILDITLQKSVNGGFLKLYVDTDDGKNPGERIDVQHDLARIDLAHYQGKRLIIKLFEGGYLLDERIVDLKQNLNSAIIPGNAPVCAI